MRRFALRTFCAIFVSLLFASLLAFTFSDVNAQPRHAIRVPNGVTQALTIFVPLASNNTTLAGSINVTPSLNSARAVTKTIPPGGAVIVATGADGDKYTLTFPDGALLVTTTVTLTPVQSLGAIPVGEFVAGVQIAPDMLGLWQPASLRVELSQPIPAAQLNSVGWFGGGKDFHRFPIAPDPTVVEFTITRLHGYGLAQTLAESILDAPGATASAVNDGHADWNPTDVLAALSHRAQAILREMRADTEADRPINESLYDQLTALLKEAWEEAISPLLPQMKVDCEALEHYNPIVTGWYKETLLIAVEDFDSEYAEIDSAVEAGLRNCLDEVSEPCVLRADAIQVDLIYGYMRQLLLRGASVDFTLDDLPQCQSIAVDLTGVLAKYFPVARDPESGWTTRAHYTFTDASAAGVLVVNPFAMVGTGSKGKVTMLGRFGDEWRPLDQVNDRWLCRDRVEDRIDELIVTVSDVAGAAPPVPLQLLVNKIGCWRWQIEKEYSQTEDLDPLHRQLDYSVSAALEFDGDEPFAYWNSLYGLVIGGSPTSFALTPTGAFDYKHTAERSGSNPCSGLTTANESPLVDASTTFPWRLHINIDPSHGVSFARMDGSVLIEVNALRTGSCPPFLGESFHIAGGGRSIAADGRSASGTENGNLGEQSGTFETSWNYSAVRQ